MITAYHSDVTRDPNTADVIGPYSRWPRREPTSHRNPAILGGTVAAVAIYVR